MSTKIYVKCNVEDEDGNILDSFERQSHSFSWLFGEFLYSAFANKSRANMIDTSGASHTGGTYVIGHMGGHEGKMYIFDSGGGANCYAPQENSSMGIVVGSGDDPFDIHDNQLSSVISHGLSVGDLFYSKCDWLPMVTSELSISTILHRSFLNMSTAGVNVKEVGLVGKSRTSTKTDANFMLMRDIINPISVLPDQVLNVDIEFRTTI